MALITTAVQNKALEVVQQVNAAMYQCDWALIKRHNASFLRYLAQGFRPTPFLVSVLYDMPLLQKSAVDNLSPLKKRSSVNYQHAKTRIGYLSSDFCEHATSYLFVATLQAHDREQFDIYLYDYSPQVDTDLRRTILSAATVHRAIHDLTDQAAAELIEADEIDILVDMKGQVYGSRQNIVRYLPAPHIVNYLAYPGTNGPCTDYVITDKFTFSHPAHFYEKPLFLPHFYLPFADMAPRPTLADITQFKQQHDLVDCPLILGCLNSTYKITEPMVLVWKDVLKQFPAARFLLLETTEQAKHHILARFEAQAAQIVFLPQATIKQHLIRIASLDLFCDSFPVCAHTVALDAACVGTPLVALTGLTYITRVSSSVNQWMGLQSLNTTTIKAYKQKIINLCQHPEQLAQLREQVDANAHLVLNKSAAAGLEDIYRSLVVKERG